MSILNWLWSLLRQEPQVKSLIADLEAKRDELGEAAAKLRALAAKKEAAAKAALAKAEAHAKDADWAKRIADKVNDLIA